MLFAVIEDHILLHSHTIIYAIIYGTNGISGSKGSTEHVTYSRAICHLTKTRSQVCSHCCHEASCPVIGLRIYSVSLLFIVLDEQMPCVVVSSVDSIDSTPVLHLMCSCGTTHKQSNYIHFPLCCTFT
jgi:hypothetical protein